MNKFFIFGCWNYKGCKGNIHLRKTVNSIKEHDEYLFGVILGDNVYPDKKDKKREHKTSILKNGFDCLLTINKPLYVIYGNHDEQDHIKAVHKEYNIRHDNFHLKNDISETITINDVQIKMIFFGTNQINKEFLIKALDDPKPDHIVVAGHVPLVSCRFRWATLEAKYRYIKEYGDTYDILDDIFDVLNKSKRNKIYYICADTHNFQMLRIKRGNKEIEIVVSGTGGAVPDHITKKHVKQCEKDESIELLEYDNSYGYIVVTVNKDKLQFNYVKTSSVNFKKYYELYKKRYLELKEK